MPYKVGFVFKNSSYFISNGEHKNNMETCDRSICFIFHLKFSLDLNSRKDTRKIYVKLFISKLNINNEDEIQYINLKKKEQSSGKEGEKYHFARSFKISFASMYHRVS